MKCIAGMSHLVDFNDLALDRAVQVTRCLDGLHGAEGLAAPKIEQRLDTALNDKVYVAGEPRIELGPDCG